MAAGTITTTQQDITGDFDLYVTGINGNVPVTLMKALGTSGTEFEVAEVITQPGQYFVKNTGTNAFKKSNNNGTVKFSQ